MNVFDVDIKGTYGTPSEGSGGLGFWKHSILMILAFLTIYPFFYMLITSLKNNAQIRTKFWHILPEPIMWSNYSIAWKHISPCLLNTAFISLVTVIGVVFLSSLSAFVFAHYKFKLKEFLYYMILALMMIPGVLTLIPQVILVRNLHIFNTHWGVILPYIAGRQIMAIFILRSFFETIPMDYFDAARIDGASEFGIFMRIALPLSKPILGTVAVMNILATWNDYVWPLIVISDERLRTVTIGLQYFRMGFRIEEGQTMAGNVIAALPMMILFLFTSRLFIKGITTGGLKA